MQLLRRISAISLLAVFLLLGSGAPQYMHECQHAAEDAREDAIAALTHGARSEHHHDEGNCEICAQLHLALFITRWTPLLICLGLLTGILVMLPEACIACLALEQWACRGPPVVAFMRH